MRCSPGSATASSTRCAASTGWCSTSRRSPRARSSGSSRTPPVDHEWRRARIAKLLEGQREDGGFGVHPYSKWKGGHWRLISLVELGIPRTSLEANRAADHVLDWIAALSEPLVIEGRERRHAS